MKILHCSDIHLDSPLSGLGPNAKVRRDEITSGFCELVDYAAREADALIIAGDLFDGASPREKTVRAVTDAFRAAKNLVIFLLAGNHDAKGLDRRIIRGLPENVFTFEKTSTYGLGAVAVSGLEAGQRGEFSFDESKFNILVLHGDEKSLDFKRLEKLPVDYFAMGHWHAFSRRNFGRGVMCYSGAPEPRGFDETGETGFVLLDTDKKGEDMISHLNRAKRKIVTKTLDVTGISSDYELGAAFESLAAGVSERDYLNLVCIGRRERAVDAGTLALKADRFFAFRLEDGTAAAFDLGSLLKEQSVFGEFARLIEKSGASERVKNTALEEGLGALGYGEQA